MRLWLKYWPRPWVDLRFADPLCGSGTRTQSFWSSRRMCRTVRHWLPWFHTWSYFPEFHLHYITYGPSLDLQSALASSGAATLFNLFFCQPPTEPISYKWLHKNIISINKIAQATYKQTLSEMYQKIPHTLRSVVVFFSCCFYFQFIFLSIATEPLFYKRLHKNIIYKNKISQDTHKL